MNPARPAAVVSDAANSSHESAAAQVTEAFQAIRAELLSTLTYMLHHRDDAADMLQETFVKCWRARATLAGVDNPRAWIFRVAMNCAKDHQRSAWKRRVQPMAPEDLMLTTQETPMVGFPMEQRETLDRLKLAILSLRSDEREVFLLRQNGELTYEEIADIRGAPVGTIKTQMRAALQKLRKVLQDDPGGT